MQSPVLNISKPTAPPRNDIGNLLPANKLLNYLINIKLSICHEKTINSTINQPANLEKLTSMFKTHIVKKQPADTPTELTVMKTTY